MIIVIPGAYNAQTGVPGGNVQGQTITVGAILKVTERDRRPYPTDPGVPSEIWIDNTAAIGYICKESGPAGTVWDRLDLLGDYIAFGDGNPGPNTDILWGYRPGSLRYSRNTQTLWICDDNTQGAAIWSVLGGGSAISLETNGLPNGDQTLLNIVQGTNITITDDGFGNITFDATGGGGTYTVNNGLIENPASNFQLGGATLGTGNLVRDTYITNDGYVLRIDQTNASTYALDLRHPGTGLNAGSALRALTGDGYAIRATSTGAIAYEGVSSVNYTSELIRNASSFNDIVGLLKLTRGTTGTSSGGIGGSIDFWIEERQTIPAPSPTDPTVRLAGLWENPGPAVLSRLSRFDIYGYSNGGALLNASIRGDGAFSLYQYGINTFAGTPAYALGVDAVGNVVEFTPSTGGGGILKGTASGTDTYTTTISGVTSYNDGDAYLIRFTNGNTTGCTLNINSLGAITLYRNNDGALIGGDIISGAEMLCIYNSTLVAFQVIGTAPNTLLGYVTNDDSVTITKGQVVYAFGGQGDRMTVKLANNTSDATSARTVGVVLSTSIAANQKGLIMMQGLLDGLNILPTATWSDGDPVYLGATAGSITKVKPYAPNHLVYVGIVTTASNGSAGRMYVNIQNGYELDELHNVQAQSPTYKDTLWYDNTVSPAQWKTASIATILGYTPGSVTSVSATVPSPTSPALSVNVSNPTTTPAIAITANGTTSQYFRGDGSLAAFPSVLLQSGRFAWLTQLFEHSQGLIYSIEYVAAYNKIFVGGTGNNVSIFDATTGELLSTVAITTVQRIRYISSINEVWTTSSTTAIITRISPVTNASLGTITTSVVANGWEILEYSSTKVFITIGNAGGSILVVNPTTLAVTATITTGVPSFPSGMALNNNVASAQYDRIVVAANLGVAILNPTTNTITATIVNPSSAFSGGRDIVYSPTDDKYYAASQVNHRIICLNIASATTFTLNKIKYSAYQVIGLQIDETNDLLMFTQLASGSVNLLGVFCNFIQKSTFDSYTNIVTSLNGGGNSIAGPIKLDATNKRVFVAGTQSASRSVITVRYL